MSRVTLKDIAGACGLSRAAVSLVLQDSPRVSEPTKARVRQVMAEMGYVYDRGAANLRTRRSMTVGLIVTNVRNPYFAELTMAVEQGLHDARVHLAAGLQLRRARPPGPAHLRDARAPYRRRYPPSRRGQRHRSRCGC